MTNVVEFPGKARPTWSDVIGDAITLLRTSRLATDDELAKLAPTMRQHLDRLLPEFEIDASAEFDPPLTEGQRATFEELNAKFIAEMRKRVTAIAVQALVQLVDLELRLLRGA